MTLNKSNERYAEQSDFTNQIFTNHTKLFSADSKTYFLKDFPKQIFLSNISAEALQ